MHSKFTRFLIAPFVIFITLVLSVYSQPVKRVLLEQHTGAWCGWCVDGTVKMDSILALHPDNVIGVKIHNGDSMFIPEQSILSAQVTGLGISSYPSGTIDRRIFNNAYSQSRNNWCTHCETCIAGAPKVDVKLSYIINEESREL